VSPLKVEFAPLAPLTSGAPPPPPAPEPVAAPVAAEPAAVTFHDVMMKCQTVTPDYLTSICAQLTQAYQVQVNSITDISSRPDMCVYTSQLFQRDGKW
jgi:hypothetical protein